MYVAGISAITKLIFLCCKFLKLTADFQTSSIESPYISQCLQLNWFDLVYNHILVGLLDHQAMFVCLACHVCVGLVWLGWVRLGWVGWFGLVWHGLFRIMYVRSSGAQLLINLVKLICITWRQHILLFILFGLVWLNFFYDPCLVWLVGP